jgi:hypothetical protein
MKKATLLNVALNKILLDVRDNFLIQRSLEKIIFTESPKNPSQKKSCCLIFASIHLIL